MGPNVHTYGPWGFRVPALRHAFNEKAKSLIWQTQVAVILDQFFSPKINPLMWPQGFLQSPFSLFAFLGGALSFWEIVLFLYKFAPM